MAISLSSLTAPERRPLVTTIFGLGKRGKTTLASKWKGPVVMIRTEDGTATLAGSDNVAVFPRAQTVGEVFDQIEALKNEAHEFRTLVIDSVTEFNVLAEKEILDGDPKAKSLNQACGGFGAGTSAVANLHRLLREKCQYLNEVKGMQIVFIGHASTETIDPPDGAQYTKYTLRMDKKCVGYYTDNVDLVAYIDLKTFTTGTGDVKKATTSGDRIIRCVATPSTIAGNRLHITEQEIPFPEGSNPFAEYLV